MQLVKPVVAMSLVFGVAAAASISRPDGEGKVHYIPAYPETPYPQVATPVVPSAPEPAPVIDEVRDTLVTMPEAALSRAAAYVGRKSSVYFMVIPVAERQSVVSSVAANAVANLAIIQRAVDCGFITQAQYDSYDTGARSVRVANAALTAGNGAMFERWLGKAEQFTAFEMELLSLIKLEKWSGTCASIAPAPPDEAYINAM